MSSQADLYAGAIFITKSTGFEGKSFFNESLCNFYLVIISYISSGDGPIYLSILVLLAIACVFTIAGGLTAVIWTDFIQVRLEISDFSYSVIFDGDDNYMTWRMISDNTFTFPGNLDDDL